MIREQGSTASPPSQPTCSGLRRRRQAVSLGTRVAFESPRPQASHHIAGIPKPSLSAALLVLLLFHRSEPPLYVSAWQSKPCRDLFRAVKSCRGSLQPSASRGAAAARCSLCRFEPEARGFLEAGGREQQALLQGREESTWDRLKGPRKPVQPTGEA